MSLFLLLIHRGPMEMSKAGSGEVGDRTTTRATHGYLDTFRILARACLRIRILCHLGIRIPDTVCGYHDVTQNDLKCSSHPLQSAVNDHR